MKCSWARSGRLVSPVLSLLAALLAPPSQAAEEGELGFERPGDLPALRANASESLVVEKLRFTDCRTGRRFTVAPIDGRTGTRPASRRRPEYPMALWNGRSFGSDLDRGLHVQLADRRGFNLVRIQGGSPGRLYRDLGALGSSPARGGGAVAAPGARRSGGPEVSPVHFHRPVSSADGDLLKRLLVTEVRSDGSFFRKLLATPAVTRSVSFYGSSGGYPSEVGFYRVGPPDKPYRAAEEWWLAAPAEAPREIAEFLASRFGAPDRTALGTSRAAPAAAAVPLPARSFVHCMVGPLDLEEGLTAVELDLQLEGLPSRCPVTVRVHDPFNPRQELMAADVLLSGAGRARLLLDFPNQVLPPGTTLWLSLAARDGGWIAVGKDGSRLRLLAVPRDSALPEALAYRKLFLRGYLHRLSEEPSDCGLRMADGGLPNGDNPEAVFAGQSAIHNPPSAIQSVRNPQFAEALQEFDEALAQCRWLAPEDPEVDEYDRLLGRKRHRWEAIPAGRRGTEGRRKCRPTVSLAAR